MRWRQAPGKSEQPEGAKAPPETGAGAPSKEAGKAADNPAKNDGPPGKAEQPPPAKPMGGEAPAGDAKPGDVIAPPEIPVLVAPPAGPKKPTFEVGEIVQPALWFVLLIVFGAAILMAVKRMRQKADAGVALSPHDQLNQFRAAYEAGEMTEAEFKKVKLLLSGKIKDEGPAPPAAPLPPRPPAANSGERNGEGRVD